MASPARVLFVAADATVDTEAPVGLFVGAAWLSVSTGLRADHHGEPLDGMVATPLPARAAR